MKRLVILTILISILFSSESLQAASPIRMRVTPQVVNPGGSVRISVFLEKHPLNTYLIMQWVGPISGESKKELEGENTPIEIVFDRLLRNLSRGQYEITAILYRTFDENRKAETFVIRQRVIVGGSLEDDIP